MYLLLLENVLAKFVAHQLVLSAQYNNKLLLSVQHWTRHCIEWIRQYILKYKLGAWLTKEQPMIFKCCTVINMIKGVVLHTWIFMHAYKLINRRGCTFASSHRSYSELLHVHIVKLIILHVIQSGSDPDKFRSGSDSDNPDKTWPGWPGWPNPVTMLMHTIDTCHYWARWTNKNNFRKQGF